MNVKIVPPVVVAEGLDVRVFQTVSEAERALEARDVFDGIYEAYDAEGRPVRLDAERTVPVDLAAVQIAPSGEEPAPETLAALLRNYLKALGETAAAGETLSALLDAVVAKVGYAR